MNNAKVACFLLGGFILGLLTVGIPYKCNPPDPEVVEVHHTDTIVQFVETVRDSIQGPIDTLKIDASPPFPIRDRIAVDAIALNWQYFKTDTITARSETPHSVYDGVILIRRFYYRGGPR